MLKFSVSMITAFVVVSGLSVEETYASSAEAQVAVEGGQATAAGQFDIAIREEGAGCMGALVFPVVTVQYDNVPGGAMPTTAHEIGDAMLAAINAAASVKYYAKVVYINKTDPPITWVYILSIWKVINPPAVTAFDVCVDGIEVAGNDGLGQKVENGITVVGRSIQIVPVLTPWGLGALVSLVFVGGGIVLTRHRSHAGKVAIPT